MNTNWGFQANLRIVWKLLLLCSAQTYLSLLIPPLRTMNWIPTSMWCELEDLISLNEHDILTSLCPFFNIYIQGRCFVIFDLQMHRAVPLLLHIRFLWTPGTGTLPLPWIQFEIFYKGNKKLSILNFGCMGSQKYIIDL